MGLGQDIYGTGAGSGFSIVYGCEIVTNAPSVHFMASAINKMLQQTGHTHTHSQRAKICANNMGERSQAKVWSRLAPSWLAGWQAVRQTIT